MSAQVDINPKLLIWAREERFGKASLLDIAKEIKVAVEDLAKWEHDGKNVPFDSLEILAKVYKRQTAIFFLPDVPQKTKKIKDFRNLANGAEGFSPDTLLAVRRTERYLNIARELQNELYWKEQYHWMNSFTGKKSEIENEANKIRELLGSPPDGKLNKRKSDDAFRYWRKKVEEKLGIFVFQFSMPESELDGFSYAFDHAPFAIVINNKKPAVRKTFTLFHELAHILKHDPGACKTDPLSSQEKFSIELDCNVFAGEFLVPGSTLQGVNSVDQIFEFAKEYNVSGETYLRRLFEKNKISRQFFFQWLEEVREKSNSFPRIKREGEGGPSMLIQSKSIRGAKFFDLISNAAIANQLSYSTAADLLGLKASGIPT
jgi:Zn-dependent peptidase ImmA (M78 family)